MTHQAVLVSASRLLVFAAMALFCLAGGGVFAQGTGAQEQQVETASEVVTQDLDGDDETETVIVFRNEEGRVVRAEADSNGDGVADMWAFYGLDEKDRFVVELRIDHDGDGLPNEWQWSEAERVVRIGRDTRGDGAPDVWTLLDERGVVIEVQSDTDADGIPDTWSSIAAAGRTEWTAYDTNEDGSPDRWIYFDSAGNIERIEVDTDGDGAPDREVGRPR